MAKLQEQFIDIETEQPDEQFAPDESIESLRRILSQDQHRDVSYLEAQEIGEALVSFYTALCGDS